MCYSILVETDMKKLGIAFEAELDFASFVDLYEKRNSGAPHLSIPAGIDLNFNSRDDSASKKIQKLITKFNSETLTVLENKIKEKTKLVSELDAKLTKKWFKSTEEKFETAKRVIATTQARISRISTTTIHGTPEASRIMQYSYAPLIIKEGNRNLIKPMRYQVRARGSKTEVDRKINMFNARLESIEDRKTWERLFMHNHGILHYLGFYEWVIHPKTLKPAEIFFKPQAMSTTAASKNHLIWSPALFDIWTDGSETITSFAIITTEPPKEIAALGHDRCPVIPNSDFHGDWLNPQSCNKEFIYRSLQSKEPVEYAHSWV